MFEKLKRWLKELPQRYRDIPGQIHSRNSKTRSKAQKLIAGTICIPLMLLCAVYMIDWQVGKTRVEQENANYSALYQPEEPEPAAETDAVSGAEPTAAPAEVSEDALNSEATAAASAEASPEAASETTAPPKDADASAAEEPSIETTSTAATPRPTFEPAVDATFRPVPTPDADTIVYAMETPPPVQESFEELLAMNPETVGFLTIDDVISLPVVQKPNNNEYYLNHSFEGRESDAGTLFLDGSNLLVPEDSALIIYGHNMRNGTMFQPLIHYEKTDFLKKHPLVHFDTIYENRVYVPFAAFTATLEEYSECYLDVRQFSFSQSSFERYIDRIRELSLYDSPVDAAYGDSVLMLVTCEYLHDNGRFIVALRELRPDETEEQAIELVQQTKLKYGK